MIDPNNAIAAAGEGAKAIGKFEDILQKVFGPRWTKKQADADAYADGKKLQTIRDNPDMEIIFANGQMNARLRTPEALAYRAEQRQLSDSIRQEENIENIIDVAANDLYGAENTSDQSVDDDWITRFFSIAKDINSRDMQFVWGKMLAGEINNPGSFSLRTLETIRNLSRKDAEIFEKIMPLISASENVFFISSDTNLLNKYGIYYPQIMHLDECGLINSRGSIQLHLFRNKEVTDFINNTKQIMIINSPDGIDTPLGIHLLTSAGKELYKVLLHEPNSDYFNNFASFILDRISGNSASVSVYQITGIDGDRIHYSKTPEKTFSKEGKNAP